MAVKEIDMSVIAFANGFTLWHYKTPDAFEEVLEPGYFKPLAKVISAGDIIIVTTKDGSNIRQFAVNNKTLTLTNLK